jgi:hypothetical protein
MTDGPAIYGYDLFGDAIKPKASGIVAKRFGFPPFSLLDARAGVWQDRRRAWLSIGLESEIGRDATIKFSSSFADRVSILPESGEHVSIFDPVLCEMAYRWFCPPGGQIVDPFAGGSVRGIVAAALDRDYWGGDVRLRQIEANRVQAEAIDLPRTPIWVVGDSVSTLLDAPEADFVFSCPPYADLEVYSDDPTDLSTMPRPEFLDVYRFIIARAASRLANNRFAAFVVGDVRYGKQGAYRGLPAATIDAFEDAGLRLYNDAVLMQSVPTAGMRAPRLFSATRKLVTTHQRLLVFLKGDAKAAVSVCGEVQP